MTSEGELRAASRLTLRVHRTAIIAGKVRDAVLDARNGARRNFLYGIKTTVAEARIECFCKAGAFIASRWVLLFTRSMAHIGVKSGTR